MTFPVISQCSVTLTSNNLFFFFLSEIECGKWEGRECLGFYKVMARNYCWPFAQESHSVKQSSHIHVKYHNPCIWPLIYSLCCMLLSMLHAPLLGPFTKKIWSLWWSRLCLLLTPKIKTWGLKFCKYSTYLLPNELINSASTQLQNIFSINHV